MAIPDNNTTGINSTVIVPASLFLHIPILKLTFCLTRHTPGQVTSS
jgi:hypothetical protein